MTDNKTDQYWLTAAADIRRFCKGEINAAALAECYPEFEISDGYHYVDFGDCIYVTMPEGCPLQMIAKIAQAAVLQKDDVNRINDCKIRITYQPAWEKFTRWSKLKEVCENKQPIVFEMSARDKWWRDSGEPVIDIRFLLHEGSHGDSDGYGVEDDTWLVGLLFENGTWFKEWHLEGDY